MGEYLVETLNKKTLRQMENLKDICDFDLENQVASILIHYDSYEEIIDKHLSRPNRPVISNETVEYLTETTAVIPNSFRLDISIQIDDYGEYNHKQLLDSIKEVIEDTFYYYDEHSIKQKVLGITFIAIGILILAVKIAGKLTGIFGPTDAVYFEVLDTILDVFVWVLLWEGGYILFVRYEEDDTIFKKKIGAIHSLSMVDSKNKVLYSLDEDKFYEDWVYEDVKEKVSRNILLIVVFFVLTQVIVQAMNLIGISPMLSGKTLILAIVQIALMIILALSNVSFYRNKGFLCKVAIPVSYITLACSIIFTYNFSILVDKNFHTIFINSLYIGSIIVNIICLHYLKKIENINKE